MGLGPVEDILVLCGIDSWAGIAIRELRSTSSELFVENLIYLCSFESGRRRNGGGIPTYLSGFL